jgi:hypothetical protein
LHFGATASHRIDMVLEDDPTLVAFERAGVLAVMNVGPGIRQLDPGLVAGRTVVLSSVAGHTNALVVLPDATMWLAT